MLMFEDLDWKGAFRRAAFAALLYLLFVYVMSIAFPDSFGPSSNNLTSALVVAVAFFFIYAPVFAFAERRKRRRLAELNDQKKGKPGARMKTGTTGGSGADGEEAGDLRGRHNPNTSRKKAARRRRR
jgi:flagellar biosynthesis/type III secretory pathway M-ring protein FliF/YscJ